MHMAQLLLLPLTVSCFSKIPIGFTFLVPAHPGSPRQRAAKHVCVCVLQREHSALLSKLDFVCDLVQCIVSVAEERRSPLAQSLIVDRSSACHGDEMFATELQRCVEQLVLYVRALHLLASGLQLAQCALRDGNLEPSKTASRSEFEYSQTGLTG